MKVEINLVEAPYGMLGKNEHGYEIPLDSSVNSGGNGKGFRPMETLLLGIASCSSIDVLDILKKQRLEVEDLHVSVQGKRADTIPAVFTHIHLTYEIVGDLPEEKVKRAVQLSMDKYCSVAQILNKVAEITFEYHIKEPLRKS